MTRTHTHTNIHTHTRMLCAVKRLKLLSRACSAQAQLTNHQALSHRHQMAPDLRPLIQRLASIETKLDAFIAAPPPDPATSSSILTQCVPGTSVMISEDQIPLMKDIGRLCQKSTESEPEWKTLRGAVIFMEGHENGVKAFGMDGWEKRAATLKISRTKLTPAAQSRVSSVKGVCGSDSRAVLCFFLFFSHFTKQ